MLFHDRGTVNIADVVRYTVTYDPSLDPINKPKIRPHLTPASHAPRFHPKLHLRIRNNASMLLRAAYLQGPYILAVSVREDTFCANEGIVDESISAAPVYDQEVKASTSFWAELTSDKKYFFIMARLISDILGLSRLHPRQYSLMLRRHIPSLLAIQKRVLAKRRTQTI